MDVNSKFLKSATVALFLCATATPAMAQEPAENISATKHGNLAAAQTLVRQAFDRITAAQQDHNYDLGGHAGKAKDLLRQANDELKLAAESANSKK